MNNIRREMGSYGELFVGDVKGCEHSQIAGMADIEREIPPSERETIECPYCNAPHIYPINQKGYWTCLSCAAS